MFGCATGGVGQSRDSKRRIDSQLTAAQVVLKTRRWGRIGQAALTGDMDLTIL
jgi:hypothetical protein